jgi:hypothetical protein
MSERYFNDDSYIAVLHDEISNYDFHTMYKFGDLPTRIKVFLHAASEPTCETKLKNGINTYQLASLTMGIIDEDEMTLKEQMDFCGFSCDEYELFEFTEDQIALYDMDPEERAKIEGADAKLRDCMDHGYTYLHNEMRHHMWTEMRQFFGALDAPTECSTWERNPQIGVAHEYPPIAMIVQYHEEDLRDTHWWV